MILSASRRTDIPAFFPEWLPGRLREGFLCVRNPMSRHQVSRIRLDPEVVDCIVFWTKNPAPMLPYLERLSGCPYYFQCTVTGYGKDVEPNVPDKRTAILPSVRQLVRRIGKGRVIWRYDPILFTDRYTPDYHLRAFRQIAQSLRGYVEKCVISFVDLYAKNERALAALRRTDLSDEGLRELAGRLSGIARENGMTTAACAERIDLTEYGIERGSCVDKALIEKIIGMPLRVRKDPSQRPECGCVASVDVGSYDTCPHGCAYCYANRSQRSAVERIRRYDPTSPLLCDRIEDGDKVTEREARSLADGQLSLPLGG